MNRVADFVVGQAAAYKIFYCRSRARRKPYGSGDGKDYGLSFPHSSSQCGFQTVDESYGDFVEPQAKLGCRDPVTDLPLDRSNLRVHR